jgi:AcrR family transcriptional regulator
MFSKNITMDDIANELGITKGNLYYYFKNKQDILFHCHMRSIDISLRALDEALSVGQTPRERLSILLTGHIRGSLEDGFGGRLQTDLEDMRPDQRKLYVRKRDELEQGVRRLIADGVRDGQFECANVKLTGFAILGAINWMPKWYRANGPYTPAQIADEMVDYFLRGLIPIGDQARRPEGKQRGRVSADVKSGRAFEKAE